MTQNPHNLKQRAVLSIAVAAVLAPMLAGCSKNAPETQTSPDDCTPIAEVETIKPGKLTVLIAELPPFAMVEEGRLTGVEGTILNILAEQLCLEVSVHQTSFAAAIEGLQNNRGDISANNWTVNDERRELFEVSDPFYLSGMGIVSREGRSSIDELDGKKIGIPQGYIWVEEIHEALGSEYISEYQTDTAILDDVIAGRLDAGVVAYLANAYRLGHAAQYSELEVKRTEETARVPYTQVPASIVALTKKGNVALNDAVNQVIREYTNSGELALAFESYGMNSADVLGEFAG